MYDDNNIFARILRGEVPCKKVHEDEHTLAFEDISPQAPIHTVVVPKGKYVSLVDFTQNASDAEAAALMRALQKVAEAKGVDTSGYRVLSNCGPNAHQTVPHLHFHVLAGRSLGLGLIAK